jgi:hypothetical protein
MQDALRVKKVMREAKNAAGLAPGKACNAAHGLFGRNPKGISLKQHHSLLRS